MSGKLLFDDFKASLKEKWLDYYEANRDWLNEVIATNGRWYNDTWGGVRPDSRFILGVASVLEPQLQEFLPTLTQLNSDPTALVRSLGLDFEPDAELAIRAETRSRIRAIEAIPLLPESDAEYLDKIRQENLT